jgi:hypothetical protein
MNANPTLLEILQSGARVEFANGVWLRGEPETAYINFGFDNHSHGLWSLDEEGLKNALNDADDIYAEWRGDDFSDIAKPGFGILIMTRTSALMMT